MPTDPVDDDKPSITTSYAAEYLGSTPNTLKRWRALGKGPPYYRGLSRKILYKRSDLDLFIASRRVDTRVVGVVSEQAA